MSHETDRAQKINISIPKSSILSPSKEEEKKEEDSK